MKIHPSHRDEAQPAVWALVLPRVPLLLIGLTPVTADLGGISHYLPLHTTLETLAIALGG